MKISLSSHPIQLCSVPDGGVTSGRTGNKSLNMEMAIVMARDTGMEWIFHLDTDELIHPAGAREYSLRQLLSDVPDNVDMVIFPNYGSDFAPKAIDIAAKELISVATPGEVDQVQLDRAKAATKSAVLMNLESRMVASEDIGRQILTYGERVLK